jgi:hypothetical protein
MVHGTRLGLQLVKPLASKNLFNQPGLGECEGLLLMVALELEAKILTQ